MKRAPDLTRPRGGITLGAHYDPDAFGRLSEGIARYVGTARYLVIQTVLVALWITVNAAVVVLRWDAYPFLLLNLALSGLAAYAAPLIILGQNRQVERDRVAAENDRRTAARILADTEFLARELAAVRIALADVVTVEELDRALERVAAR